MDWQNVDQKWLLLCREVISYHVIKYAPKIMNVGQIFYVQNDVLAANLRHARLQFPYSVIAPLYFTLWWHVRSLRLAPSLLTSKHCVKHLFEFAPGYATVWVTLLVKVLLQNTDLDSLTIKCRSTKEKVMNSFDIISCGVHEFHVKATENSRDRLVEFCVGQAVRICQPSLLDYWEISCLKSETNNDENALHEDFV